MPDSKPSLWKRYTGWFTRVKRPVRIWLIWWYFNSIVFVWAVELKRNWEFLLWQTAELSLPDAWLHNVYMWVYVLWRMHGLTWLGGALYLVVIALFLYWMSQRVQKGWKQLGCLLVFQVVIWCALVLASKLVRHYPYSERWETTYFYISLMSTYRATYEYPPSKEYPPVSYFPILLLYEEGTFTKDDYRRYLTVTELGLHRQNQVYCVLGVFMIAEFVTDYEPWWLGMLLRVTF